MPARKRKPARSGAPESAATREREPHATPPVAVLRLAGRNGDGDMQADEPRRQISGILLPPGEGRGKKRGRGGRRTFGGGRAWGQLRAGDMVLARLSWSESGDGFTARLIHRISRERAFTAVYRREDGGGGFLEPVERRDRRCYSVAAAEVAALGLQDGDLVTAEARASHRPSRRNGDMPAKITARHGNLTPGGGLSVIAALQHELPLAFSPQALKEADSLRPFAFTKKEAAERLDLRDAPFVTLDPEDARDHDDAVWAQPDTDAANPDGWILWVAIADVAAYVAPGSALDAQARERGNSTYFPDGVLPMLPERLSADLCSLRAGEERPVLAARMVFDKDGHRLSHSFSRAVIKSAAALAYEQAQAAIDGEPSGVSETLLETALRPLWGAYRVLRKARETRQPLELEMPEHRIRLREDGAVASIEAETRLDAHRLIEECMIAANSALAKELVKRPLVHRVHEPPSAEKRAALQDFLRAMKLPGSLPASPQPKHFNANLNRIKDGERQSILAEAILRAQSQAFYSPRALGHFGLQLRHYAHFTSPIRRYADLLAHRALIAHLRDANLPAEEADELENIAAHISETERRSVAAERDTNARYMALWLQNRVGERMLGRIVGISRAGLFVRLQEIGMDGFTPLSRLPGGPFRFDAQRFAMVERYADNRRQFQVGAAVTVRILEADSVSGRLLLDILPSARGKEKSSRRADSPLQ